MRVLATGGWSPAVQAGEFFGVVRSPKFRRISMLAKGVRPLF